MKLENCKVGMIVKVKSLEKCNELGNRDDFHASFHGKEVKIIGEPRIWVGSRFIDQNYVEVEFDGIHQSIPIICLKKIKQAD